MNTKKLSAIFLFWQNCCLYFNQAFNLTKIKFPQEPVKVGDRITISCSLDDFSDFQWCTFKHENKICQRKWHATVNCGDFLDYRHYQRAVFVDEYNYRDCKLQLTSVSLEDSGQWQCTLQSYHPNRGLGNYVNGKATLDVKMSTKPDLEASSNDVISGLQLENAIESTEGKDVTFSCSAKRGFQWCTFKHQSRECHFERKYVNWRWNLTTLECADYENRIKLVHSKSNYYKCVIKLKNATAQDAGKWVCELEPFHKYRGLGKKFKSEFFLNLSTNNLTLNLTTKKSEEIDVEELLPNTNETKNGIFSHATTKKIVLDEMSYVNVDSHTNLTYYVYTLVAIQVSISGILIVAFTYYYFTSQKNVEKESSSTISVQSWEWTGTPIVLDSEWIPTPRSSSEIASTSFVSCSSSLGKY